MITVRHSENLLRAVKSGEDTTELRTAIAALTEDQLREELPRQEERLAFWLNLYNAFFQILIKERPGIFRSKYNLFRGKYFKVAGHRLSLDDIEHGLLRKAAFILSLGYIRNPYPAPFKNEFQVFDLDPRIHFALNCGARSCPPIRFYSPGDIHEQLDIATRGHLEQEALYEEYTNTVHITPIFSLFRGDFNGMAGIRDFLYKYSIIPHTDVKVKFNKYNWERSLDNYAWDQG